MHDRGTGANLINIQRLGLRLRLEKASTGMHSGLRLIIIFESYKHGFEAHFRTSTASTEACPKSNLINKFFRSFEAFSRIFSDIIELCATENFYRLQRIAQVCQMLQNYFDQKSPFIRKLVRILQAKRTAIILEIIIDDHKLYNKNNEVSVLANLS